MEKGKQVLIVDDEEPKPLQVWFDEDALQPYLDALVGPPLDDQVFQMPLREWEYLLSTLCGFLQDVEESAAVIIKVPGMTRVCEDVALLQAFLTHLPEQFVQNGTLMREIHYLAERLKMIIFWYYYREEEMDESKAFKLVKRLDFILQFMSHWMDLIRMIYGKHSEASPPVLYSFVNYQAPLDALFHYLQRSRFKLSWNIDSMFMVKCFLLLRAILMDYPEESIEYKPSLQFIAREIGFAVSSIDLNNMDYDMADLLCHRLEHIFQSPPGWWTLVEKLEERRPKPSRNYYPKTGQLNFLDLSLGNLGELLDKAKDDRSIGALEFDILELQRELKEVSFHLMEIPEPRKEEADMKDIITNIANLAYEAEYVIDSFLVADIPFCYSMLGLRDIVKELKHQRGLIKLQFGDANSIVSSILFMSSNNLEIIPLFNNNNTEIAGTLSQVFNRMLGHRYVCTRSLVSFYREKKKEVLLDLLRNASSFGHPKSAMRDHTSEMSIAELEELVYNLLEDKNFFVILEDVQDIYALNDMKRVLPNDAFRGQAILFTTPFPELVVQCRFGFDQISEHHPSTSRTDKSKIEKDVVGFRQETKKMLEQLTGGPKKLLIISIIGMAGQGKTTLAEKLFSDPLVNEYFDTRAWCYVSQVYEKRKLLLELLGQVIQLSNKDHLKDDVELGEILYKHLKGRRFLILLDDMWKIDAWNDLERCFPNDKNGSRIMFTTRIQGLASQAKSDSILQPLGLLSNDESWVLLQKKLFLNECCPIELLDVGRKIAKNCKGLPISVVLTAGLLAKMEKKVDRWEHIAKSLSSLILDDAKAGGKGIIELSYKHLPEHLKPCFLYFGAFLEDREIQVSKLIRLWIAEGFVRNIDLKSLEEVAQDYFTDLIGRSLVTIIQEKSNGAVKSCRVHDLLHEFCLTKARDENFLQQIDGYDEQYMDPSDSSSSTVIKYHLRRLCIYPKRNHFTMLKPSGPLVRSLLFFAGSDMYLSYSYNISSIFHNFKFIKILNLEGINIGDSFNEISALIVLKYLACQSYVDLIPSSIANLWNLQTFSFKGLGVEVVKVSDSIWDMTKLRHLHINNTASFDFGPHRLENSSMLDHLQTLSTPSLAYGDGMEKILRRVRGIRKLKCIFLDSWNDATNHNQFPELGFLNQLVSLNVFYNGKGKYPCEFSLPSNLTKLTLSNFRMPWNEFSQLASLCNLEVLKLLCNAFEGERWEMDDEVFPRLKFLKLDTLNVVEWIATSDSFPILKSLLLHNCEQLEEIPLEIGEIHTLQMIEVMWCSLSVAISATKIQVEQLDFGNEELKVHVHP